MQYSYTFAIAALLLLTTAHSGTRFTQGYVSHPVCSPPRAGLLTGRYQQRHGWEFNPAGRDLEHGMSTSATTFADALKNARYATGMVGKWHLGYRGDYHPRKRGFDEYFGVLAGASIFIDPATPGVESAGNMPATRSPRVAIFRDHERIEVEGYLTDVFTEQSVDFIERHQHEPFFLYLSHTTPHTPLQATKKYLDRYRDIEDKANLSGAASDAPHEYLYWRADGRLQPPQNGWPDTSPNGQRTLLYDLENDPGETRNLARAQPQIVARLAQAHTTWAMELRPPILPGIRSTLTEVDGETVQLVF